MSRRLFRLSFLPLLLVGLTFAGCERSEMPGAAIDAQFSAQRASGHRKVPARGYAAGATTAAQVIGPAGGSVELAGHHLVVPAGAVSHPTRFTLRLVENGFVEVDLRAARASGPDAGADVGKKGFSRPVILSLSYDQAELSGDPEALVVAWVRPDGSLQPLRSSHDGEGRTITAPLDHFSRYVLSTP